MSNLDLKHLPENCTCVAQYWKITNQTELHWFHRDNEGMEQIWLELSQSCCPNNDRMPFYEELIRKRIIVLATKRGIDSADTEVREFDMEEFVEVSRKKGEKSITAKKVVEEFKPPIRKRV